MQMGKFGSDSIVETKRIYVLFAGFALFLVMIVSRLWYLQIYQGPQFAVASEKNRFREVARPAPRGMIFDRDGTGLLSNRPFFDLVIIPQYLQNKDKTVDIISEMFKIPKTQIIRKLQDAALMPKFVPVRIKRNLSLHEVAMLESNKFFLPGVDIDTMPRRDYSHTESPHLLGYLGEVDSKELDTLNSQSRDFSYRIGSIIGKLGIEKKYEQFLRGQEGRDYLQVDALGRLQTDVSADVGLVRREDPRKGLDIYLTIDSEVQKAAIAAFRNKNGALAAMNPQTGEVLAYVSNPSFSLSIYQDGLSGDDWQTLQSNPFKPLLDKVTGGAYPPGSTYKIITALAALEEGVVNPEKTFTCNGIFTLGNGRWRCWKKEGHGVVNMRRAIELSCDVYFYQVGNLLGVDRIAKWAQKFGIGEKTGLDLNKEHPGILPTSEWKLREKHVPWQSGDTINLAIGQGFNLTTPMQILSLFAAVGNSGQLYRPYILRKIVDDSGKVLREEKPELRRVIPVNPKNLAVIHDGLFNVVNSPTGTGKKARVQGFSVSGKTGTAQTSVLRKAKEMEDVSFLQRDHAWFAAYSPSENPEIAVVVLSEYDGGGGGAQAAPIAQQVIEAYWAKKFPEKFPKNGVEASLEKRASRVSGDTLPGVSEEAPLSTEHEGLGGQEPPPVDVTPVR